MQPNKTTFSNRPSTSSRSNKFQDTSRISIASSTITQNKYPKCDMKKQHNKELLNLVCLTDTCKNRGVICSMCKSSDHSSHIVVPVRKFLQKMQECLKGKQEKSQKNLQNESQKQNNIFNNIQSKQTSMKIDESEPKKQQVGKQSENTLQTIEKSKNKMLYHLSIQVNAIADQIRKIQDRIISQAQTAMENIQNIQNLQKNIAAIMEQLQEQSYEDSNIYRSRIDSLISCTKCKTKQHLQISSDGATKISDAYLKMSQHFVVNIQHWFSQCSKLLQKVFQANPNLKQYNENDKIAGNSLKFSSDLKIKSIELTNQNKSAKLNQKLSGFVLGLMSSLKQKSFKIKISHLENSIIIGVGFKDIMKTNQFKFVSNAIGHGAYVIGHNSYIYSHHSKAHNSVMKGLSFATGQQITVALKGDTVNFSKKSDGKTASLPLKKMTDVDWKQLVPCFWLGGIGDKIDIIQ